MSKTKGKRSQKYPAPLIVEPLQQHKISLIVLHGRGSNAQTFGPVLLNSRLPGGLTFQETLPTARFIFPTASFRRSTALKRIPITQWFDNFSLDDLSQKPEFQVEGLKESSQFVHNLIQAEVALVGAGNVIIGGLSQGCATMLISLLLWVGSPLRAAFGMSGRLPFAKLMSGQEDDTEDFLGQDNPFESDIKPSEADPSQEEKPPYRYALMCLREELEISSEVLSNMLETPIFLGHGTEDEKVRCILGKEAFDTLQALGCKTTWHEYEGLGHWYHAQELADIVSFIQSSDS